MFIREKRKELTDDDFLTLMVPETIATHSDRVEECKGSLHLVRGSAGWLIDRAENIQCSRQ